MTNPVALWSNIELEELDDVVCIIRLYRDDVDGKPDIVELYIPTRCAATAGTALLEVALGRSQAERVKRRLGYDGIAARQDHAFAEEEALDAIGL